ncbi:MAG: acyl-CoA carboxylase subunit beta [Gammaproteobacteria bacterium]|nr:acyl-CoA carboxylase subunit beta [Gammaproteobacteria bacterium]
MNQIRSRLDVSGAEFTTNVQFMEDYVARIREVENNIRKSEERYRERAVKRGKLLPRERLAHLLDPGAPFLELCSIAGYGMDGDTDGSTAGGNIVVGVGYVSGRRVLVMVWNYAIRGGTISSVTTRKNLRMHEIAFALRLPVISLSESGGGNLSGGGDPDPWGVHGFLDGGRVYCQQAELSAAGIPQITVAHGNATAGGAYQVALSDYVILVRGQTHLFLAGPPLLKAATGEEADHETLGGAEMHATVSQTGEYLAENDADGIRLARAVVDQLPPDAGRRVVRDAEPEAPAYPAEELRGIVSEDKRIPYDMREVIARVVDGSKFLEFEPDIDDHTLCGHAYLDGWRVGIITNNGPITPEGAKKASQFLQLCDQSDTPMVFLQNTTGFLVGLEAEVGGQVKHGSKMIQAVANFRPPKLTIIVGNSYGAGNYAMCSKSLRPEFVFSWPTARQAVMGGAQAAKVMTIVAEDRARGQGTELTAEQRAGLDAQSARIIEDMEFSSEAMHCSSRMMDDGIIDPCDTRNVLAFCLNTVLESPYRGTKANTFGVARL